MLHENMREALLGGAAGRVAACLCILLVLATPAGAEAQATFSSAAPVHVEGELEAVAPAATFRLDAPALSGQVDLHVAHGIVRILTWKEAKADADALQKSAVVPLERADVREFHLQDARLLIDLLDEPFFAVVRGETGGTTSLATLGNVSGEPEILTGPFGSYASVPHPMRPENVEWSWEAGWFLAGDFGRTEGFPAPPPSRTTARFVGPIAAMFEGGNASFVAADGEPVVARLGRWQEDGGVPSAVGPDGPITWTRSRMILDATLTQGSSPVAGTWAMASPSFTWIVNGTARWTNATGTATDEKGVVHRFEDAPVSATGTFNVTLTNPASRGLLDGWHYDAIGADTLVVGGAPIAGAPAAPPLAQAAAGVSLAALLYALGRGSLFLYTRLHRSELLDHPARKRIHEAVKTRPGLTARELQREVDLAWGAFSLHLRTLVSGGYLCTRRVGRYLLVFPRGADEAHEPAMRIPHPVARELYALLPDDGSRVPVTLCRKRLGVSRQRLDHHLKGLAKRGLVHVESDAPRGERLVARATPESS